MDASILQAHVGRIPHPHAPPRTRLAKSCRGRVLATLFMAAALAAVWSPRLAAATEASTLDPEQAQAVQADDQRLAREADLVKHELGVEGFSVSDLKDNQAVEVVPANGGEPPDHNRMISIWLAVAQGAFGVELLNSENAVVLSWEGGTRTQQTIIKPLPPGKYVIKVNGTAPHGVIGIKDLCPAPAGGEVTDRGPRDGFSWPFLLYTPTSLAVDAPRLPRRTLLVLPNNTAQPTEDPTIIRQMAKCDLEGDFNVTELARRLGTPVLIPLFPRPELREINSNLALQSLTRASMEEDLPDRFKRVDLQLTAMIDAARQDLAKDANWPPVQSRVLMAGLSAGGAFTSRYAALHPDRVLAAAAASPSGWPIAPVAVDHGTTLRYPVGVADLQELTGRPFDLAAFRRIRFLFLLGLSDTNDAVGHGNNYYRDSYSDRDADLINSLFGETMAARWPAAERLYQRAGVALAHFKRYPGVGHEIKPQMWEDVLRMFREALNDP